MFKNFKKEWKEKDTKEKVYMVLGGVFLVLAVVGVFLPIIPQVPFAIAAAAFFSRGSKKIHEWIRENKYFGQPVKDWEDDKVVRPKLKAISTVAMVAGGVLVHFKLDTTWAIVADVLFAIAIVFVLTRKSTPDSSSTQGAKHGTNKIKKPAVSY